MMKLESNEKGLIRIENLSPGQYYLKETETLASYFLDPQALHFEIPEKHAGKPATLQLADHLNVQASIEVLKLDGKGNRLSGVEFSLLNGQDKTVMTAISNEEGTARFEVVAPGQYQIIESKASPSYIRNEEKILVNIDPVMKEDNHYVFTMHNYQAEVLLHKEDEDGQALEGVTFDLYRDEVLYLENLKTSDQGEIHIENLSQLIVRL